MRTTSRGDIGRGMDGVSGRWSSKSKYISGLHDYTAPRARLAAVAAGSQLPTHNSQGTRSAQLAELSLEAHGTV